MASPGRESARKRHTNGSYRRHTSGTSSGPSPGDTCSRRLSRPVSDSRPPHPLRRHRHPRRLSGCGADPEAMQAPTQTDPESPAGREASVPGGRGLIQECKRQHHPCGGHQGACTLPPPHAPCKRHGRPSPHRRHARRTPTSRRHGPPAVRSTQPSSTTRPVSVPSTDRTYAWTTRHIPRATPALPTVVVAERIAEFMIGATH